ncbi:hypothetical protein [Leptospira sp. GIMC2001]|uniref:hypothetical protein n=1 Tax=Leptospira sp. GIMC2001 TaxID=1513297 RepID=UPI00234ABE96|nr:hypothetical protein [Leptospira sp. GIMC2001]WCL50258.1 hypothetical protein O4O04_05400 [Leptospira sp. GIMC2001]
MIIRFMKRFLYLAILGFGLLAQGCVVFQKSTKIKPIAFDYKAIGKYYFNPKNDKPFPLTIQRGNNLYNSTTADGKYLFYATNKEGNFDIWFRDLNSSVIVPITEHPSQEYKPAISPDGRRLVFVSEQFDSDGDLMLLDIDPQEWVSSILKGKRFIDTDFKVLTNPEWKNKNRQERVIDTDPVWMPNSEQIVFSSDRYTPGIQNLILLDLSDNNSMTQLTYSGGSSPYVSADGKTIYYLSYRDSQDGEIYSLNLEDKKILRITNNNFLDYSPSVSSDNRFLFYTSIRKDTNGNGVLDERDYSVIVQRDLKDGKEKFLSSGDNSVFDTKYSDFNGGSVLFSASFYNSINIYFIPYTGSIPKQSNIIDQFTYALEYEKFNSQSRYFLALESIELFYEDDPLYPIYKARADAKKVEYLQKKNRKVAASSLIGEMSGRPDTKDIYSRAQATILDPKKDREVESKIKNSIEKVKESDLTEPVKYQLSASLLHLLADWYESKSKFNDVKLVLREIQLDYPEYHLIREIKNKSGFYEFRPESVVIPHFYQETLRLYEERMAQPDDPAIQSRLEIKDLLFDLENKIRTNRNSTQILEHITSIESDENNPKQSIILKTFLAYLKASTLRNEKNLDLSSSTIDAVIPIPQDLEMDPPGQKSIFEYPEFIKLYRNPALSYVHYLRYKNAQDQGNGALALRNLRIFMEFYDPLVSPELDEDEFSKLFLYWERKAIEYERLGDLRQAAVNYYFNNLGMSLAKSKNISVDRFYGNYAVYYQRKMLETIFQYGRELREKEEAELINRINILGEGKLDVIGNLSDVLGILQKLPFLDALKILGDFRDLQNKDVLHENALSLADLYFNYHLEKNRPFLNLAVVYGYSYYLINRTILNETALYKSGAMTANRKQQILENYKKAEYELRWILFADPTFPDAYQLLGWLYQYIDIIKSKKVEEDGPTEEERYSSVYEKFFPEKNFEENVELYTQILEFLGEDYPNKKILSDLNLNLGNNYFLLSNYPKANESGAKVDNLGRSIVSRSQFEDYRQEAVFRFNYGRSALYRADYKKAIEQFEIALEIYTKREYYQSLSKNSSSNEEKDNRNRIFKFLEINSELTKNNEYREVKSKLALLNSMIGLCRMEMGNYEDSIPFLQSAISHNRVSKEIDSINLWNALAIAYQKTGRYRESKEILSRAEEEYRAENLILSWLDFSFTKAFWRIVLPDNIRVLGDGRFPGEFPLDFKSLLTRSIQINNLLEEKDFRNAASAIKSRSEFIEDRNLKKWVMGDLVNHHSFALEGQIHFQSGDYLNASQSFNRMKTGFGNSGDVVRERIAIIRKNYSGFAWSESEPNNQDAKKLLEDNLSELFKYRDLFVKNCKEFADEEICLSRLRREFKQFDTLVGLNYFYLGEIHRGYGNLNGAYVYYSKALTKLRNPANVDPKFHFMPQDPFNRKERIRIFLNLARLYLRLGDSIESEKYYRIAKEGAYEFRLERESFQSDLIGYELTKKSESKTIPVRKRESNQLLIDLKRRFESEKTLPYNLLQHTLEEYYSINIDQSMMTGRFWDIPLIADSQRNFQLSREVLTSSLEYSDLRMDKYNKDFQIQMKKLDKIQMEIENKSIKREKVDESLRRKSSILKEISRISNDIKVNYPQYFKFYNQSNLYSYYPLDNSSISRRCMQFGDKYMFWNRENTKKEFKQLNSLEVGEYLSNTQIEQIGNKKVYLNPGNCEIVYKKIIDKAGNNHITLVTKEADFSEYKNPEGIAWRWRTLLVDEKLESNDSRIRYNDSMNLNERLLDTDLVFVTKPSLSTKQPILSYAGSSSLNLREIFTNPSEIAGIVLEVDQPNYKDINRAGLVWDLASTNRKMNLLVSSPLTLEQRATLDREELAQRTLTFGTIPQKYISVNPISRYRELRSAGIFQERAREYTSAYELFYDAGSFLDDSQNRLLLENELDMARMKRKIFPEFDPDYFYKTILKNPKLDIESRNIAYSAFLKDCLSDRFLRNSRSICDAYYKSWKEQDPVASLPAEFYSKMYNGEIRNLDRSLEEALKLQGDDEFLRNMQISDLYLENFLFQESEIYANRARRHAISPREKGLINARILEIRYHESYVQGREEFAYSKIPAQTTYALGFNREWDQFTTKVNSEGFRKLGDADSIYDEYRKRLYHKWKEFEFGREFEPISLIPDELYEGGSVLSKMTHLNRSLYFYLLSQSAKHQTSIEGDSLMDILIAIEKEEGFNNRAYVYALLYADQLLRDGKINSAKKYISFFEKDYDTKKSYHPYIEKIYSYLIFRLSQFDPQIVFPNNAAEAFGNDEKIVYNLFRTIGADGPESFAKALNSFKSSNFQSKTAFTRDNRNKAKDIIQYMMKVAFDFDSSDGFLDALHFQDTISAYNEQTLGSRPRFTDLPRFYTISDQLIAKIPVGQDLHAIGDYLNKTYLITVSRGSTKGREIFANANDIHKNIRKYYSASSEGGEATRLRDLLEDRYKNTIRMKKDQINYLYLSGSHLQVPLLQKLDIPIYQVQNLSSLLTHRPRSLNSLAWSKSDIKKYRETNFTESWFQNLKSVEDWEISFLTSSQGNRISISQEEARVDEQGRLVFGSQPVAKLNRTKSDRQSVWIASSFQLGAPYSYSNLLNNLLFHLDDIHIGPGIISLEDQSEFQNTWFIKNLLVETQETRQLRYRFLDARTSMRDRYSYDKYWHGYRIYTSSFILP